MVSYGGKLAAVRITPSSWGSQWTLVERRDNTSTTRITSQPQLGSAVAVVGNTAQGHTVPVPADTTTTGQTLLAQHQQTVDDLPLTHISPAIDNSPEDEPHTEEGTFSNAYSFMLPYIVIIYISTLIA